MASAEATVLDTVASINIKLAGEGGGEAPLESLRQLQAVPMTFKVLEATKIGWTVNALRKTAPSEPARELAAALYRRWKTRALEHLASSRKSQAPVSATTAVSEQQKLSPATSNEAPEAALAKSVRGSLPIKAKPPAFAERSGSSGCKRKEAASGSSRVTATVKKQRSTQASDATRKAAQPALAIRQRAVADRKPAPASKPISKPNKEASPPVTATPKIVVQRVAPLATAKPQAAAPPKPNGSSARKRKEAPTTASIDEARLAMVKRRLQERYKEAADSKEKRRIQFITAPGMATQRRHEPSSVGSARCGVRRPLVPSTVKRSSVPSSSRMC